MHFMCTVFFLLLSCHAPLVDLRVCVCVRVRACVRTLVTKATNIITLYTSDYLHRNMKYMQHEMQTVWNCNT